MLYKQGMIDGSLIGNYLVSTFLINGEFLDELEHQASLIGSCWTDIQIVVHGCKNRKILSIFAKN
jgi:hypothetical protein